MSEFTITYQNDALADDTVVSIPDVGEVKNGGTLKVTEDMQNTYASSNPGQNLRKSLEANACISVSTAKKGGDS